MYHSVPAEERRGSTSAQKSQWSLEGSCTSSMSLQNQRTWNSGTLRGGIAQSKVANQTVKHRTPLRPLLPAASAPSGVTLHRCSTRTLPTMKQLQHMGTKIKTSALLGPRTQHQLESLGCTLSEATVLNCKREGCCRLKRNEGTQQIPVPPSQQGCGHCPRVSALHTA